LRKEPMRSFQDATGSSSVAVISNDFADGFFAPQSLALTRLFVKLSAFIFGRVLANCGAAALRCWPFLIF